MVRTSKAVGAHGQGGAPGNGGSDELRMLRTLIDHVPDFVFFKDTQSRFLLTNQSHWVALGAAGRDAVVGKTDFDYFPRELARQYYEDEQTVIRSGQPLVNREETYLDRNGAPRWLLTTKVPLRDADGCVVGLVGISRDVTPLKEAEEALRQAQAELEQRVQVRTQELSDAVARLEREIAEHRQTEEALRSAQERYHAIFEQASDSIVVSDTETGRIEEFNDRACRNLGYTREEFARLCIADVEAAEAPEEVVQHYRLVAAQGQDVFETRHRGRNGEIRNVLIGARRITLNGALRIVSVWHDITDRKRMEDQLLQAIARLEEHDRAREEFISNVSHELKTPLTSMLYATRNLQKGVAGPLSDKGLAYVRLFEGECRRMLKTVGNILDLRKAEQRTLSLSCVRVPLGRLVARSVDAFRLQAESKLISLEIRVDQPPPAVDCDLEAMERVVHNLLDNAIKFTSPGGHVQIALTRADDRVHLLVQDDGLGVPPAALERLTERYFRAGNHPTGSGLGLAITREIVERHAGTLAVASPPPGARRGTLVRVNLPPAPPPFVVVGADDEAARRELAAQIAAGGYETNAAPDLEQALLGPESARAAIVVALLAPTTDRNLDLFRRVQGAAGTARALIALDPGGTLDSALGDLLRDLGIPAVGHPAPEGELLDQMETVYVRSRIYAGH